MGPNRAKPAARGKVAVSPNRAKPAARGKVAVSPKCKAIPGVKRTLEVGEKVGNYFRKLDGTVSVYPGGRYAPGTPRNRRYESKDAKISRLELALETAKSRVAVCESMQPDGQLELALESAKKRIEELESENKAQSQKIEKWRVVINKVPDPTKGCSLRTMREVEAQSFIRGRWKEYRRWMRYIDKFPVLPDVPPGEPPDKYFNIFNDEHLDNSLAEKAMAKAGIEISDTRTLLASQVVPSSFMDTPHEFVAPGGPVQWSTV